MKREVARRQNYFYLVSAMAYNMYLFTKGDGPLKTTHDLFTQAEVILQNIAEGRL